MCLLCAKLQRTKFRSDENDVCCSFFNGTFISVKSSDQNWPLFLSVFHSLIPNQYGTLILHFSAFFTVRFFLDSIRFHFFYKSLLKKMICAQNHRMKWILKRKKLLAYLFANFKFNALHFIVFLISNEAKIREWHVLFSCLSNCM